MVRHAVVIFWLYVIFYLLLIVQLSFLNFMCNRKYNLPGWGTLSTSPLDHTAMVSKDGGYGFIV